MSESRFRVGDLVALADETSVVIEIPGEVPGEGYASMSGFYWANGEWWWYADLPGWDQEYASGRVVR